MALCFIHSRLQSGRGTVPLRDLQESVQVQAEPSPAPAVRVRQGAVIQLQVLHVQSQEEEQPQVPYAAQAPGHIEYVILTMKIKPFCFTRYSSSFIAMFSDFGIAGEVFACPVCSRVYKYKRSLAQHLKYECNKEPAFSCPHCPYKAKKRNNLKAHYGSGQKFGCGECGRSYKYKQTLVHHQRFECGKEPMFQCPHCPHRAKQKSNLKTHVMLRHADVERLSFACERCNRVYKHRKTLTHHQRYECNKEPSFSCPFCAYRAKQKSNLRTHVYTRHTAELQHKQWTL
ncbi:hypothetical protein J6590_014749 [Homalodisca vitripennis]|nr:hypothetical protein J6590_014749 [Homalodisca vitripennis]